MQPISEIVRETLCGHFVHLEPLREDHRDGLERAAKDPGIWRFLPLDASTPEGFGRWFGEALSRAGRHEELPFAVRYVKEDRLIGSTRFSYLQPVHERMVVGWTWYHPDHWSSAVNPETRLLQFSYAFETLNVVRIEIRCDARNERGNRALSRLGAVREGVLRSHRPTREGIRRDTVVYSILSKEWPGIRQRLRDRLDRYSPDDAKTRLETPEGVSGPVPA